MPHQCVKCKEIYEDGSDTLLKGCKCGARFFFFFKQNEVKEEIKNLSFQQIKEIEEDVENQLEKIRRQIWGTGSFSKKAVKEVIVILRKDAFKEIDYLLNTKKQHLN